MQRKSPLVVGEIYHIYNRGVEKRSIFSPLDTFDYQRFLLSLQIFNSQSSAEHSWYWDAQKHESEKSSEVRLPRMMSKQEPLVEILAFCLVENHYHLLLREINDNGITEFMRKLGTGYTNYFNTKYERVGPLFQGKFKSVLIERNEQLQYIPHYIHLNALDMLLPGWKEHIADPKEAIQLVKNYPWSSASDLLNDKYAFPFLSRKIFEELFGTRREQERGLADVFGGKASINNFSFFQNPKEARV